MDSLIDRSMTLSESERQHLRSELLLLAKDFETWCLTPYAEPVGIMV